MTRYRSTAKRRKERVRAAEISNIKKGETCLAQRTVGGPWEEVEYVRAVTWSADSNRKWHHIKPYHNWRYIDETGRDVKPDAPGACRVAEESVPTQRLRACPKEIL